MYSRNLKSIWIQRQTQVSDKWAQFHYDTSDGGQVAYDTDAELFYTRFAMSTKSFAIAEIGAIVDAASSNMTRWMKQLDERLFRIRRNTHDWIQKLPSKLGLCTLVVDGNHSSSTFVSCLQRAKFWQT